MRLVVFLMVIVLASSCSYLQGSKDSTRKPASGWQTVISCFDESNGTGVKMEKTDCYTGGSYGDRYYCRWQAVVLGSAVINHMRGNGLFYDGAPTQEYIIPWMSDVGGTVFNTSSSNLRYVIKPEKPMQSNMKLEVRDVSTGHSAGWVFRNCKFY